MNWKYDGHRSKGLAHPSTQWPPRIKGTSDRQAGNRLLILKEYLGRKFWGKPRLSVSQTNTTLSFYMCLQIKNFEQQWNFELILTHYVSLWASLVAQNVKNLPAMRETWIWCLGWEDPLEKGTATHSNILAWGIPWTEEPGGLQPMGSQRVGHNWATFTSPL